MSIKFALVALFLASANGLSLKLSAPDVSTCMDGTDQWFSDINLDVNPWPVHIAAGEKITISAGARLLQTVVDGSKVRLDLNLKTLIGNLHIPCLPIDDISIGSCEYEVSKLLADLQEAGLCDLILPEGQACAMPLEAGEYAPGDDVLEVVLPDIPDVLQPFLKGRIEAKVYGMLPDNTEIACLSLLLELN